MENKAIIVLCTTPDITTAQSIARLAVETQTVACCNIIQNVTSVYTWQSEVCEEMECQLVFKTMNGNFEKLQQLILENHSYEVPEIIAVAAEAVSPEYLKWIENSIR